MQNKRQADLLAIDPGYQYLAYSIYKDKTLIDGGVLKNPVDQWATLTKQPPNFSNISKIFSGYEWSDKKAVIEFPLIHKTTPNPNDIVKLASASGAYTALLQHSGFFVEWVEPRTWKGTVPKKIMLKRIIAKLSEEEYSSINHSRNHNLIDAVGVGLWKIKRL